MRSPKSGKLRRIHLDGELMTTEPAAVNWARNYFLSIVARRFPDVLRDLSARGDVDAWSRRWRLDTDWARSKANDALELWRGYSGGVLSFDPNSGGLAVQLDDVAPPRFFPQIMSEAEYRREHEAYVAGQKRKARERGMALAPTRDAEHFDWLALYQVGSYSAARIAKEMGALSGRDDPGDKVEKAIVRLSAYLGLPRRRGRRPRRSGDGRAAPAR